MVIILFLKQPVGTDILSTWYDYSCISGFTGEQLKQREVLQGPIHHIFMVYFVTDYITTKRRTSRNESRRVLLIIQFLKLKSR